jgi:hypothetical protein
MLPQDLNRQANRVEKMLSCGELDALFVIQRIQPILTRIMSAILVPDNYIFFYFSFEFSADNLLEIQNLLRIKPY